MIKEKSQIENILCYVYEHIYLVYNKRRIHTLKLKKPFLVIDYFFN